MKKDLEAGEDFVTLDLVRRKMETREGLRFTTFLGSNAVEALHTYLEARRRGTDKIPPEKLSNDSPLFINRRGERFTTQRVNRAWNQALMTAGFDHIRLYSLRTFFDNQLRGRIKDHRMIEYMMGHDLPRGGAYFTVRDLREEYVMNYRYLDISSHF